MTVKVTHNTTAVSILALEPYSLPVCIHMYLHSLTLTLNTMLHREVETIIHPGHSCKSKIPYIDGEVTDIYLLLPT